MKNILYILLVLLVSNISFGQLEHSCLMENEEEWNIGYRISQEDMIPDESCEPIYINLNCVFLYNENGEGNFSMNVPEEAEFLNNLESNLNYNISHLTDGGCDMGGYDFLSDAKIRFNVTLHFINNELVWNHDNDNSISGCPGSWAYYWPDMYAFSKEFAHNNPNALNIYFTNGQDAYNFITSNPEHPENVVYKYANSGCSQWPKDFYSDDELNIHINDEYVKYLRKRDYPESIENGQYSSEDLIAWHFSEITVLLLHELGHNFGLYHCFDSQYAPCPNNIMNGDVNFCGQGWVGGKSTLTPIQIGRMHKTLSTTNMRHIVDCDQNKVCAYEIDGNSDVSWNKPMRLYNDVIVRSQSKLTITNDIIMPEDGKFIVERGAKLVLDGANITSSCGRWSGILVQGNVDRAQPTPDTWPTSPDDAGIVIIKNDSKLENFYQAVSDDNTYLGWPQKSNYYGGVVYCENSTFSDGFRAVEFMKYEHSNESRFSGCTFSDLKHGVSTWACEGIEYSGNTFMNITKYGINDYNSGSKITGGNTFINCEIGINSTASSPMAGYLHIGGENLSPNQFFSNDYHIFVAGDVHPEQIIIKNNYFDDASIYGIYIYGTNYIDVKNNYFDGAIYDIAPRATGWGNNFIRCNELYGTETSGIGAYYDNRGLLFPTNTLGDNYYSDIYLSGSSSSPGEVPDQISLSDDDKTPAMNCFGTGKEIKTEGLTESFIYYEPLDDNTPCYQVDNIYGNYIVAYGDKNSNDYCGDIGPEPRPDITQVNTAISKLCSLLAEQKLHPDDLILKRKIKTFYQYYNRLLWRYIKPWMRQKDYISIIDFLSKVCDKYWKKNRIGVMIKARQYQNALLALSEFEDESREDEIFKKTMEIDIAYLQSRRDFALTNSQRDFLTEAASESLPESAYAHSLLLSLTGESVFEELPLPDLEYRSDSDEKSSTQIWSIYPNPVQNKLFLKYDGKTDVEARIKIGDMLGRVVFTKTFELFSKKSIAIDLGNLNTGTYILSIIDKNDSTLKTQKIVLSK